MDCPNAQYISRNLVELAEVIARFKELNSNYCDNLCLYLDSKIWEVFDQRRAITIIRHEFKHTRQLLEDMRMFNRDFINVVAANYGYRGRNLKTSEVASIKHLYKIYGMDYYLFYNDNLRNYLYGKFKETSTD